jgi:hypothetical protein
LQKGLKNRESVPGGLKSERKLLIDVCLHHPDVTVRKSARSMLETIGISDSPLKLVVMQEAQNIAADQNMSSAIRAEAVNLMALQNPKQEAQFFRKLNYAGCAKRYPVSCFACAKQNSGYNGFIFLLKNWKSLFPGIKEDALNTFIS